MILRSWRLDDAAEAFEFYGDPHVAKYIGSGRPARDLDDMKRILNVFIAHEAKEGFAPMAVVVDSRVVGVCGLHMFNDEREPELGFRFARKQWNKGLATEACRQVLAQRRIRFALTRTKKISRRKECSRKLVSRSPGRPLWAEGLSAATTGVQRFDSHFEFSMWSRSARAAGKLALMKLLITTLIALVATAAHADEQSILTYFNAANAAATEKAPGKGYYRWNECWDEKFDQQPVGPADIPDIPAICQPDTLYSWSDLHKLQMLQQEAPPTGKWAPYFTKEIFAHINPLATFGYGPIQIRFKLKPGVKTIVYQDDTATTADNSICQLHSLAEQQQIVIARLWRHEPRTGVDYILCSPNVIQAWSVDTKTQFDEILASIAWNHDHVPANENDWIPYTFQNGHAELYDSGLDDKDWSYNTLLHRLANMQALAAAGKGVIVYAPGVPHDIASVFSTTRPIYWNTK